MKKRFLSKLLYLPAFVSVFALTGCKTQMSGILNPKGIITFHERQLMFDSLALMMIVVLPVIIMSLAFVWRFHQSHDDSEYLPNWSHNNMLEAIWWGVPIAIVLILAIMTWETSHRLDPYRKIDNVPGKVLPIQAVALPWKWLFIYPEQNIATVNYVKIPQGQQVEFFLTTDNVPMSSFFIPQLASQLYAMAGMRTRLHVVATHAGSFFGLNSQYNGEGFSGMTFKADVVDPKEFKDWSAQVYRGSPALNGDAYKLVRKPSMSNPVEYYSNVKPGLFNSIIESYKSYHHPN